MVLAIADWRFEIDREQTVIYSMNEAAEHCLCGPCRNFYGSVDAAYPKLRPFLQEFGICIEAPDVLIPLIPPTLCIAYYAVSGRILQKGKDPLKAGMLEIYPEESDEALVNTFLEGSCFFLRTERMELPWVLSEPMEDEDSPARTPDFVRQTLIKFLK